MNIGIIGVGKSKNIGDQLIVACIYETIKMINKEHNISFFDFDYGDYTLHPIESKDELIPQKISKEKRRLYWPRALKNGVRLLFKSNVKLKSFLNDKDLIIIGGGHLLIDNYLYFPLKIKKTIEASKEKKFYYGVLAAQRKKVF